MDRRNKYLESEERGVSFSEHDRGGSERAATWPPRQYNQARTCLRLGRLRLVYNAD